MALAADARIKKKRFTVQADGMIIYQYDIYHISYTMILVIFNEEMKVIVKII